MTGKPVEILVQKLSGCEDLPLPSHQTLGSSGMDLYCAAETLRLDPGAIALVPSGISLAIPVGYEGQIRPRSGLAMKHGITVLNSPGTIDSDYRGEIAVLLVNLGRASVTLHRGQRIAQLIVQAVPKVHLRETGQLPPTARGAGGYGHTGE